jgi:hypothetical protein
MTFQIQISGLFTSLPDMRNCHSRPCAPGCARSVRPFESLRVCVQPISRFGCAAIQQPGLPCCSADISAAPFGSDRGLNPSRLRLVFLVMHQSLAHRDDGHIQVADPPHLALPKRGECLRCRCRCRVALHRRMLPTSPPRDNARKSTSRRAGTARSRVMADRKSPPRALAPSGSRDGS